VVSSTPRPHFTPGKDPVPILQEAGWAPGPVWTGGKSRPHWESIPDRPDHSQSLYRLSYRVHVYIYHTVDLMPGETLRSYRGNPKSVFMYEYMILHRSTTKEHHQNRTRGFSQYFTPYRRKYNLNMLSHNNIQSMESKSRSEENVYICAITNIF